MSGKQSRKVRKEKKVSKKVLAGAAAAIIGTAPVVAEGGEFLISLFPNFSFPIVKFDDSLSTGFGAGVQLTYRPNPYFNIFVQGDYKKYSFDTKQNIGNIDLIGGTVGGGYHLPINDRVGLDINAGIGYYHANYTKGEGANKSTSTLQGLNVSGGIFVSYKLNPTISVFAGGDAAHFAYKNSKFITAAEVSPGITLNLSKAFSNKTNVSVEQNELKPVFPVFYSWYNENPFGEVEVTNNEDVAVTDVNVYFFQPQYMSQPKACGSKKVLKQGESFTVDLKAFFNEQMLDLNEKNDTMSTIVVEYKYLGQKSSATFPMVVPVYGRNNMSWEDDRCASAFVSSKDPAAMWFAKYVVSTIRENIRSGLTTNIQYAMGIFDALDQFGINYVKDPTSAFEDNVGTASIDFLQFPYQTLMYRGGDCDDLSILVCSLLESVGIRTAFITIPGHIYMAFDSGFTVEEAKEYFLTLDEFIVDGDEVWLPLEITLTDEGFNKAWHKGAWEWNTAARNGTAMMYKMEDSWKVYKPVNVPGAVARFTLPEETYVARLFTHSVDEFVIGQIMPQIAYYENRIAMHPTAQNYNDFGVLYARYGLFEQAEKQFRLARKLEYLPSILNTANLYYSMKDYTRAVNWYNEVLSADPNNSLAMIGLARCAYETGNYKECDKWYGTVFNKDIALARKYSYLGGFQQTSGRSFSLADRLEKTVWVSSGEEKVLEPKIQPVEEAPVTQVAEAAPEVETDSVVEEQETEAPVEDLEALNTVVALAPTTVEEEKNEPEEETLEGGAGDDGDDGNNGDDEITPAISEAEITEIAEAEPVANSEVETGAIAEEISQTQPAAEPEIAETKTVETTEELAISEPEPVTEPEPVAEPEPETYKGIASELNLNIVSIEDLVALAEDTVKENGETLDDVKIPVDESLDFDNDFEEESSVPENNPQQQLAENEETAVAEAGETVEPLPTNPQSSTTSVLTDVPLRAVPRFSVQPSAEWAPESAYTAETIPGMKPFEEEMGNYQNEKAFLYKEEEYSFVANPGEEIEEEKKEETTQLASLEVNPFASFLPQEDVAKMESITSFKVEAEDTLETAVAEVKDTLADVKDNLADAKDAVSDVKDAVVDATNSVIESFKTTESTSSTAEVAKSTTSDNIPVPEVIPQPSIAVSEETAVAVPVVEETTSKKSNGILLAAIAGGIAAAIAGVFIAKKGKKNEKA